MVRTTASPTDEKTAIFQRFSGLRRSHSEKNLHRRFAVAEECVQTLGEKLRKDLTRLTTIDQKIKKLNKENERHFLIGGVALGILLTVTISWIFQKTFEQDLSS